MFVTVGSWTRGLLQQKAVQCSGSALGRSEVTGWTEGEPGKSYEQPFSTAIGNTPSHHPDER